MQRLGLGLIGATLLVAACTSGRPNPGAHSSASPSSSASVALRATFPTGVSNCWDYYLSVTTRVQGTLPLTSCAALPGPASGHTIRLRVGDTILLTGDSGTTWTASRSGIVAQGDRSPVGNGQISTVLTMLARGTAVIAAHHVSCAPAVSGVQHRTCDVLTLIVR